MAVTAKGNPQNYSKPRTDCTETTSSLSSSQTSRFLLVFFCFSLDMFSRIYLFVVSGPNQGRSCFGKRLGGELPNVQRSIQSSVCGTFPTYFENNMAITLYWLADTAQYGTIANLFGVGKSTVCGIVKQLCEVIVRILLPRYIYVLRSRQEVQEKIDGFESRARFPQVVGAVDDCHVPIIGPEQSPNDYINRKGFHSLILQGLVDFDYRLLGICVGWPGKVHDARVFKNSPLFALCCARTFLPPDMSVMISGVRVPPLILGDSAYALSEWLMKPYTDRGNLSNIARREWWLKMPLVD